MGRRANWHSLAEQDLSEAYFHIGMDAPAAAERLLDAVEEAVAFLLENPRAGRRREWNSPRARDMRSWVLRGFRAYLIFYRVVDDDLEVVRFLHGARDIPRHFEEGV